MIDQAIAYAKANPIRALIIVIILLLIVRYLFDDDRRNRNESSWRRNLPRTGTYIAPNSLGGASAGNLSVNNDDGTVTGTLYLGYNGEAVTDHQINGRFTEQQQTIPLANTNGYLTAVGKNLVLNWNGRPYIFVYQQ